MEPLDSQSAGVPVFLLKTKSAPGDAYEDLLARPNNHANFVPTFVPVLQHRFDEDGLSVLRATLEDGSLGPDDGCTYGGLIFTSQRAVEAFAKVIQDGQQDHGKAWPNLGSIPVYSVGPATTRALAAVRTTPALDVLGTHTGNGDALAAFILDHFGSRYSSHARKPALLFLVGEQRRDVIPRTLMNPALPVDRMIQVVELPVYETGVMKSFAADFQTLLDATAPKQDRWVVVFSPTGCGAMLERLGLLDEDTGRAISPSRRARPRTTFIATIGPTTRDHLRTHFGIEPDICADTPSPEGIFQGIIGFMQGQQPRNGQ